MVEHRIFFRLIILISISWNVYGFSGYFHGQSMLHREPPIVGIHRSLREVTLHTIQQRVDNFDPQNNATYEMVNTFRRSKLKFFTRLFSPRTEILQK